jgi:DGQHR domain-containing protein
LSPVPKVNEDLDRFRSRVYKGFGESGASLFGGLFIWGQPLDYIMVITRDGEFINWEDVLKWFIWISPKLRDEVSKGYEDEAISNPLNLQMEAFRELRNRVRPYYQLPEHAPPVDDIIPEADACDRWLELKVAMSGGIGRPTFEAIDAAYFWGVWRELDDEEPILGIGLTDNTQTFLSTRLASTRHIYTDGLPEIQPWRLHEAIQGNYKFYVGAAKAKEIDAVSMVPSIEPMDNAQDGARWILNADTLTETWQRKLDDKRVRSIANFAQTSENNSIVNSIILFIPPGASGVNIDEFSNELSFDFEEFLAKVDRQDREEYRDYTLEIEGTPDKDHRPIWLLDGQHRTRGLAISERGSDLMLPIIILQGGDGPNDFSLADAAKLFTEINTLNKTLNKEMQYMLGQRFSINGSNSDNDWGDFTDETIHASIRGRRRANHLGYTVALRLCQENNGPLSGAIQFFGGRASSTIRYMIAVWMKEARKWYKNGMYKLENEITDEDSFNEIRNYYFALESTFNHNTNQRSWTLAPRTPRWVPTRGHNTSLIEKKIQCKNLMLLLPHVIGKALENDSERVRPIPIRDFETLLLPLRNIDWFNSLLQQNYTGGGEQRRSATLSWLVDAVHHVNRDDLPSIDDVMSNQRNVANNPGSGINSPPGNTTIVRHENHPPTHDASLTFILQGPRNCWRDGKELASIQMDCMNAQGNVAQRLDLTVAENATVSTTRDEENNLIVQIILDPQHTLILNSINHFVISGTWKNEVGQSQFTVEHHIGG